MLNFKKKFPVRKIISEGYINSIIVNWKQNYAEISKPYAIQFNVRTKLHKKC